MQIKQSFLVFISFLVLLVLGITFIFIQKSQKVDLDSLKDSIITEISHDNPEHLNLKKIIAYHSGNQIHFYAEYVNDNWILKTENATYDPDAEKLKELATHLKTLKFNRKYTAEDISKYQLYLKDFGINLNTSLWYELILSTKENKDLTIKFYKGIKNAENDLYYIKTNHSDDLYLVTSELIQSVTIPLNDLKNHDFLKINSEDFVEKVMVKNLKENQNWTFLNSLEYYIKTSNFPKIEFPNDLQEKIKWKEDKLFFKGTFSPEDKKKLLELSKEESYKEAIENLYRMSSSKNWTLNSLDLSNTHFDNTKKWMQDLISIRIKDFNDSVTYLESPPSFHIALSGTKNPGKLQILNFSKIKENAYVLYFVLQDSENYEKFIMDLTSITQMDISKSPIAKYITEPVIYAIDIKKYEDLLKNLDYFKN